jgi:hypothetical protein
LAKKCKSQPSKRAEKPTYCVQQELNSGEEEKVSIYTVYSTKTQDREKSYSISLNLNDSPVEFQLDTGSARTIVNEGTYKSVLSNCELMESSTVLKYYTKEVIPLAGECCVRVECGGQKITVTCYSG